MSVTIKDIANKLNLSYSSVSRALNDKAGVSEETRVQVKNVAKQMGYQPNALAQGLVNKASKTIGVIIPDILNPFYGEVVAGIVEVANESKYNILLCISKWDIEKEKEYLKTLLKKRVDGIIVRPVAERIEDVYENINIPIRVIESFPTGRYSSCVQVNHRMGGYLATKHLIQCGYKKIAFLGGKEDAYVSIERLRGYKEALSEFNIKYKKIIMLDGLVNVKDDISKGYISIGYDLASELLSTNKDVDGILAINDIVALGALQYIEEKSIRFPDEIGVIGFDNVSYAQLPQIQLTTVHQPKIKLGRLLFNTILSEIDEKDKFHPNVIKLEPELIIRKSTRAPLKNLK